MKSFISASLAAYAAAATTDHWAVLIAGSKDYWNYRHQADVAHAYQIVMENGIRNDHTIYMVYDDIATNTDNPIQGMLFNSPTGDNVYNEIQINYSGNQVNKETFLAVLKGDAETAGGPVLESNEESKVFIFYSDHGAPGLVDMPYGDKLYADELNDTFKYMQENKMYKDMVFYLEACEAGSMFQHLEAHQNILAVTATDATHPSYATYCGDDAVVQGFKMNTCLGDLFSVNWMEDTVDHSVKTESLKTQINDVTKTTSASSVEVYGDTSIEKQLVGDYEGVVDQAAAKVSSPRTMMAYLDHFFSDTYEGTKNLVERGVDLVHHQEESDHIVSYDMQMHYYYEKMMQNENDVSAQDDFEAHIAHRVFFDQLFDSVYPDFDQIDAVTQPEDYGCLRFMINSTEKRCGKLDDYTLKFVKHFVHTCETGSPEEIGDTAEFIAAICDHFEII